MFECFHCLCKTVIWSADFDSSDYGYDEPGIIHELNCINCGAQITYFVPYKKDEENECSI